MLSGQAVGIAFGVNFAAAAFGHRMKPAVLNSWNSLLVLTCSFSAIEQKLAKSLRKHHESVLSDFRGVKHSSFTHVQSQTVENCFEFTVCAQVLIQS